MESKICTNIEQSKKLIELGINVTTADMYYPNRVGMDNYALPIEWKNGLPLLSQEIPAWSLAALLEEIPYEICDDDGNSAYLFMDKENDNYQLVYKAEFDDFDDIETDVYEDFIDACYEMILKLDDNNLL